MRLGEQRSDLVSADSPCQLTRRCSGFVDDVRISTSLDECFDGRILPTRAEHRTPQRRVPKPISRVHRRSSFHKHPDGLGLRFLRSEVQSREALPVSQPDLVTRSQALSDTRDVTFKCPIVKLLTTLTIHPDSLSHHTIQTDRDGN
nr:hypothetical protein [Kribbella pratensis]